MNMDSAYKEIGVIHLTDSMAINAVRGIATGIANMFGSKGFDNSVIDNLRNKTLTTLKTMINANQKVCNLRMELERSDPALILHNIYGTLLEKR